jgi:branched-chain amino acid transport system permease protein
MNYVLHILIVICIYLILALSLNLVVGYAGLLSLCHAAFYGAGAYISTLLMVSAGVSFLPSVVLAVIGTVVLSFAISVPAVRLKGDYLVLASLGFQVIIFSVLYNWTGLTNGPYGITNIPSPQFLTLHITTTQSYFALTLFVTCLCAGAIYLIGNSPFGRVLKAIREDELATAALGKNVPRFKITAFAISAGFAAIAGVLFAGYMHYVDPSSFSLTESFLVLSLIIIGGTGNLIGPILGTLLLIILPEVLYLVKIPDTIGPTLRQIIYGSLIILVMRFRPQGIAGEYRFE